MIALKALRALAIPLIILLLIPATRETTLSTFSHLLGYAINAVFFILGAFVFLLVVCKPRRG